MGAVVWIDMPFLVSPSATTLSAAPEAGGVGAGGEVRNRTTVATTTEAKIPAIPSRVHSSTSAGEQG